MADIAGFRGLLYSSSSDASSLLAPPYDVIDDAGREALASKNDKNCVRVILPKGDDDGKYAEAAGLLQAWQEEGALIHDEAPAIYRYHQIFRHSDLGEQEVVRRGFIAAVRLHPFEDKVILRHERTLKGPKIDRLKLWESTQCHLSQIFTLYSDPKSEVDALFEEAEGHAPIVDGTTEDGTRHVLWRVSDPATLASVRAKMEGKSLYIADGHHRYETMLALREKLLRESPNAPERSSARFGMMFLANVNDPGLVVLPTHRMIHDVSDFDAQTLQKALETYFTSAPLPLSGNAENDATALRSALQEAAKGGTSLALVLPGDTKATLLTLRASVDVTTLGLAASEQTLSLDVTLLHELVLEKILGITKAAQEAKTNIHYIKDTQKALEQCADKAGQACFLMNATPVSSVIAVSDAGEVMPQKSTFFYPKIASGLVFNPIAVNEEL